MKIYENAMREINYEREQYNLANSLIPLKTVSGKDCLDVGCGMGEYVELLNKNGAKAIGLEGFQPFVTSLVERNIPHKVCNLEHSPFAFEDNSFDIVYLLDVIEHVFDTEHLFTEIRRVLKKNGLIVLSTPNYSHISYRIKSLKGRFDLFTYKSRHKKFYNTISFVKEAQQYGIIERQIFQNRWGDFCYLSRVFPNCFSMYHGILIKNAKQ